MKSVFKFYSFLSFFFICALYSLAWIGAAYEARHFLKNLLLELDFRGVNIASSEGIRFSGFPFNFVFQMNDVYISSKSGNVPNFEIKKIRLKSDLLMKNFTICDLSGIKKVLFLHDEERVHSFSTKYKFDPVLQFSFRKAPVLSLILGSSSSNMLSLLDKVSYYDNGVEGTDESNFVVFSDKGVKKIEFLFDEIILKEDSNNDKIVKKINLKTKFDVQSKSLVVSDIDFKEETISNDFFLEIDGTIFFANKFTALNKKKIKLDIDNFKYISPNYSAKIFGSGIIDALSLIGDFNLEITNYNNLFSNTLSNIFDSKSDYQEFIALIKDAASEIDENKILLRYNSESKDSAKIGEKDAKEIFSFAMSKLSPDFVSAYRYARFGANNY